MNIDKWVVTAKPNPRAKCRLFCFSFAGAGASVYRNWWEGLSTELEVVAIQLPGRENRFSEERLTNVKDVISNLVKVMRSFNDKPFLFFGHSVGALLCFELTRELQSQNHTLPLHLIVSGKRAPHLPKREKDIYDLPDDKFKDTLREYKGTPELVLENEELMDMLMPLLRADFSINETYVHSSNEQVNCPLTVMGGDNDSQVSNEDLDGWEIYAGQHYKKIMFNGGHFFIDSDKTSVLANIDAIYGSTFSDRLRA